MNTETIGSNAGLIWTALNTLGKMNLKQIKKITKIKTEKEVAASLGWLAKEDKLNFDLDPDTQEVLFSLKF